MSTPYARLHYAIFDIINKFWNILTLKIKLPVQIKSHKLLLTKLIFMPVSIFILGYDNNKKKHKQFDLVPYTYILGKKSLITILISAHIKTVSEPGLSDFKIFFSILS